MAKIFPLQRMYSVCWLHRNRVRRRNLRIHIHMSILNCTINILIMWVKKWHGPHQLLWLMWVTTIDATSHHKLWTTCDGEGQISKLNLNNLVHVTEVFLCTEVKIVHHKKGGYVTSCRCNKLDSLNEMWRSHHQWMSHHMEKEKLQMHLHLHIWCDTICLVNAYYIWTAISI